MTVGLFLYTQYAAQLTCQAVSN